jgi:hypothetical protein
MDTKSFQKEEPGHVRLRHSEEHSNHEWGRFKGFLRCDRQFCGEIVVVAGNFTTEYHDDFDHESEEPITHEVTSYRPHVMSPAPEIIKYPTRLNKDSKEHLLRSFVLFWVDHASCANRLRIVTEFLLDQLGIARNGPKGSDKNARLDLFDRIELLKLARPGHEDALNALRSVGNVGSHDGVVDFDDLLTCYEAIEDTMLELIDERKAKLAQKIQDINARKGKPKP